MMLSFEYQIKNWVDGMVSKGLLDSVKTALVTECGYFLNFNEGFLYLFAFFGGSSSRQVRKTFLEISSKTNAKDLPDMCLGVVYSLCPSGIKKQLGIKGDVFVVGFLVKGFSPDESSNNEKERKLVFQKSSKAILPSSISHYEKAVRSLPECDFYFHEAEDNMMIALDGFSDLDSSLEAANYICDNMQSFRLITIANPKSGSIFLRSKSKGPYTVIATNFVLK